MKQMREERLQREQATLKELEIAKSQDEGFASENLAWAAMKAEVKTLMETCKEQELRTANKCARPRLCGAAGDGPSPWGDAACSLLRGS